MKEYIMLDDKKGKVGGWWVGEYQVSVLQRGLGKPSISSATWEGEWGPTFLSRHCALLETRLCGRLRAGEHKIGSPSKSQRARTCRKAVDRDKRECLKVELMKRFSESTEAQISIYLFIINTIWNYMYINIHTYIYLCIFILFWVVILIVLILCWIPLIGQVLIR